MGINTKQLHQPDDYSEHTNKHSVFANLEPCHKVFCNREL